MKKNLLIILLTVFSFNAINAEVTWKISNDGTLTISGTDMPNYYNGAPWFENKDKIKKIVIENGVTNIGSGAFYHCDNLTSITIPNSVTNIGDEAFYKCSGLTSIVIPNASIGNDAFYECEALTSVTIGNSKGNTAVSIGDEAFMHCYNITMLTLGNSVTSIGNCAFWGCYSLLPFTIPSSVTSIGDGAFSYCPSLFSLTNLATVPQKITEGTFFSEDGTKGKPLHVLPGCKAAYEAAEYWKDFTIIEDATTGFTWDLSNDGILTISGTDMPNYYTLYPWSSERDKIKDVVIEDGMTNIGYAAFSGCSGLNSITIPKSVTSIGEDAFKGCTNLNSVTVLSANPPTMSNSSLDSDATIHVLAGCKTAYEAAEYWNKFTIVEDATTGIDAVEGPATISSDKIFSISGQRLDKAAKGVNIINGKKVLVK